MEQWLKSYFVQTDVGMHRIVTVGRSCSKHLPEFILLHLKKKIEIEMVNTLAYSIQHSERIGALEI